MNRKVDEVLVSTPITPSFLAACLLSFTMTFIGAQVLSQPSTLSELLHVRARTSTSGISFLNTDGSVSRTLKYSTLLNRASSYSLHLKAANLHAGRPVILASFEDLESHLIVFWACCLGMLHRPSLLPVCLCDGKFKLALFFAPFLLFIQIPFARRPCFFISKVYLKTYYSLQLRRLPHISNILFQPSRRWCFGSLP
jgi:hypothetical protein